MVDSVCTGKEPLIYKTEALKYGEYIVIQRNHGIGYKEDTKIYKVVISEDNEHPYMILYNQLLKNRIEIVKYACLNQVCAYEKNAKFEVRDSLGNVVDYLKTNEKGESSIIVGYGSYFIKQIQGLEDYTLADDYKEKIVDEESPHKKELFNYKEDILKEEVVIPPKTSVDSNFSIDFLFERLLLIVKLLLSTI